MTATARQFSITCATCPATFSAETTGIRAAETMATTEGWRWIGPPQHKGTQWLGAGTRLHCPACARRITHVEIVRDGQPLRELIDRGPDPEVNHLYDVRGVRLASRWGGSSVFAATDAGQLRMRADVQEGLWPPK
jgi:hypothetical protein